MPQNWSMVLTLPTSDHGFQVDDPHNQTVRLKGGGLSMLLVSGHFVVRMASVLFCWDGAEKKRSSHLKPDWMGRSSCFCFFQSSLGPTKSRRFSRYFIFGK